MFEHLVVSGNEVETHKPWSVVLSAMVQSLILGVLVLIPLIYTQALPKAMLTTFLVAPAPPPPPPPPQAVVKQVKLLKAINVPKMVAPTVIPKTVEAVKEEAPVVNANGDEGVAGGTG